MRLKKSGKRLLALIMAVIMMVISLSPCISATADAKRDKSRIVTIAYGFNDFINVNDDGIVTGYYAEYLERLALINNWTYRYVEATWNRAIELLDEGKIDFLFPTNYTEERDEYMDFTTIPIGYTAAGIFALEDSKFQYEGYSSFDGAKITFSKGSSNEQELADYAKEHNFKYTPVYRDTNDEMKKAVENGEADLAVFSAANDFDGGMLVAIMDERPVYFSVKAGNEEMLAELNNGMQIIMQNNSELVADVLHKTIMGDNMSASALTAEERAFLESGAEVRIGFYEETEPLAYIKENGDYAGAYIKLLDKVKEKSGINFVYCPLSRDDSWVTLIKEGKIDFYIGSTESIVTSDNELKSTVTFMDYANILTTRSDCAFNKLEKPVVALTSGRAYWADYIKNYIGKEIEIKYYRTAKDCMVAVVEGEADASFLNNIEYNYHSKNDRLSSLIQWQQYRFSASVGLATSTNVDDIMFSTVNKELGLLTSEFVGAVIDECLGAPYTSYTMADNMYNARFLLSIISVVLIALGVVAIVIEITKKQKRDIQNQAVEQEKQQLEILAALSRNYVAIYFTNLDEDYCEILQAATTSEARIPENTTHSGALEEYVNSFVLPEYRELLLPYVNPEKIIERFKNEHDFTIRFQVSPIGGEEGNFEMHFVDISSDGVNKMVFGVRCINETIKDEQVQQRLLKDALEGANRANAAKSEFLSRMSHDIRTPMNAIIGMTAIAQAHIDDAERVLDSLSKISNASNHLLGLINDVLDMSKIESGKLNLIDEDINLRQLVEGLIDMLQPQLQKHNHQLKVDLEGIVHNDVVGDSMRIRQAFINLMSNAVKYTPDNGEISLIVRETEVNTSQAACYEFVFKDNGIGMTEEVMEHIFEPFNRAENSQINKIMGTGLGLPITRNIAQMMNGNIQVSSKPGEGSTFIMTIFLKLQEEKVDDEDEESFANSEVLTSAKETNFTDSIALLVDDNELNREIAREILEMSGITVHEAHNGQQAIEAFAESPDDYYDIIFMDIQMPILNGYDATVGIRSLDRADAKSIPIVAMTANAFVEDIQKSKKAGMNDHLAKPIDFAKLRDVLSKYLG